MYRAPTGKNLQVFGMFGFGFWFLPVAVRSACTTFFSIILKIFFTPVDFVEKNTNAILLAYILSF